MQYHNIIKKIFAADINIKNYGDDIGLPGSSNNNLPEIIANLVGYVLSFIALIAVIMIIFGGFQWLTAAGDDERISSAKRTISSAIIGLVIVFLAWSIVSFVIGGITNQSA